MISRKDKEIIYKEELIIDAADRLFRNIGLESATMDAIAKAADYTKPTLYKYFKNKEEIILGVYLKGWYDSIEKFASAIEHNKTGIEKLEAIANAYYTFFIKNEIYFDLIRFMHSNNIEFYSEDSERKKTYDSRRMKFRDNLKAVFLLGKVDGTLCNEFDETVAVEYFLNNLYIAMFKKYSDKEVGDEFLEKSKQMILRTFRKL